MFSTTVLGSSFTVTLLDDASFPFPLSFLGLPRPFEGLLVEAFAGAEAEVSSISSEIGAASTSIGVACKAEIELPSLLAEGIGAMVV